MYGIQSFIKARLCSFNSILSIFLFSCIFPHLLSLLQFYLTHMHPQLNVECVGFWFHGKNFAVFLSSYISFMLRRLYQTEIYIHTANVLSYYRLKPWYQFNRFTFFSLSISLLPTISVSSFILNNLHCRTSTLRSLKWLRYPELGHTLLY